MGRFRDEMRASWRANRPRRPVAIYGDTAGSEHGITERLGADTHRPVRNPDRWKRITILGGEVRADGKRLGKYLLEGPENGGLVADVYGQERMREMLDIIRDLLDRVAELERIVGNGGAQQPVL